MEKLQFVPEDVDKSQLFYSDINTRETNYPVGSASDVATHEVFSVRERNRQAFIDKTAELNRTNLSNSTRLQKYLDGEDEAADDEEWDLERLMSMTRRHERGLDTALWIRMMGKHMVTTDQALAIWNDFEAERTLLNQIDGILFVEIENELT